MPLLRCAVEFAGDYNEKTGGLTPYCVYFIFASDWEKKAGGGIATIVASSKDAKPQNPDTVVTNEGGANAALEKARQLLRDRPEHKNLRELAGDW